MSRGDAAAAATWDRLAARYGAQERHELRALEAALELAAPGPGERLVDLATGTALVLRLLAAGERPPREALGVDRSQAMLARAGALPPGFRTLVADARAVPLADGCADVVTCAYLLHLLDGEARAAVLAEARRLLGDRAAGRLVAVTVWSSARPARAALTALAAARPRAWGGLRPLDPTADLAAAGFAVTRRLALARRGYPSLVLAAAPAGGRERSRRPRPRGPGARRC